MGYKTLQQNTSISWNNNSASGYVNQPRQPLSKGMNFPEPVKVPSSSNEDEKEGFRDVVYKIFSIYYDNPVMTKCYEKEGQSVYMVKIKTMLRNLVGEKHLICGVETDRKPIGFQQELENLRWDSFHSKILKKHYNLTYHDYVPRRTKGMSVILDRYNLTDECSFYGCEDLPIDVEIHHSKDDSSPFVSRGFLFQAMETYNTRVSFRDN